MEERFVQATPQRLIGDKAYDSDPLDHTLAEQFDTEMSAPHRKNCRGENRAQDGQPLRRYKRRWKIERLSDSFIWHVCSSSCGIYEIASIAFILEAYSPRIAF